MQENHWRNHALQSAHKTKNAKKEENPALDMLKKPVHRGH
jgi:hypothetical protein